MTKLYIQVMSRINGGREYFYPVNEVAAGICRLVKQKTLTQEDLDNCKLLGFQVSVMGQIIKSENEK